MRTLRRALILLLQLAYASAGCGGSTADDSSQDAGHTGAGGTGAGGTSTGGAASTSCDVVIATAALVNVCADAASCVKQACPTALSACLGSSYASGVYSGMPCSDYGNCVKNCNCVSSCSSTCAVSTECNTCLTNTILVCVVQQCAATAFRCMGN
jgi:hypothetical protein